MDIIDALGSIMEFIENLPIRKFHVYFVKSKAWESDLIIFNPISCYHTTVGTIMGVIETVLDKVFGFVGNLVDGKCLYYGLKLFPCLQQTHSHLKPCLGILEKLNFQLPEFPFIDEGILPFNFDINVPELPNITEMFDLPGKFIDVSIISLSDLSCTVCSRFLHARFLF